jgi:hypothetical protein
MIGLILTYNGLILFISYFLYDNQTFVPLYRPRATKAKVVTMIDIFIVLFTEHYPVGKCNREPLLNTYRP